MKYNIDKNSPCPTCKHFVKLAGWTDYWCDLEVLDRNILSLTDGLLCPSYEPREKTIR